MVKQRTASRGGAKRARTAKRPRAAHASGRDLDTERRILDAAHVVFVRRGTAGARMQEIADEAGVNKALLHYYFRNKDRLSAAVFQRVARGLFGRIAQVLTSNADLEEMVRGIVGIYLDQLSETPYAPAYVLSEVNHNPARAEQFVGILQQAGTSPARLLEALQTRIDARVRAGTLRRIAAPQFFVNLVSLCVFPFAARPLLAALFDLDEKAFAAFIAERKAQLPQFFLGALRP
jgi:AcrR family transcriptional regulator